MRDQTQQDVVSLYLKTLPLKACGVLSTGFGKSKVAIDIIKAIDPPRVLILVNSTLLRDYNWKAEFEKWGELDLWKRKVTISTYQTAYKWKPKLYDLEGTFVLADEVDFAADTEELSKFFYSYPNVRVLGLTGFVTDGKREWFKEHMPIFIELTADTAQKMKILNNIHYVFVQFDLSNDPTDIAVEYMRHGKLVQFTQSENNAYDYRNKKAMAIITESLKVQSDFLLGKITAQERRDKEKSYEYKIRQATGERNKILLHSKASAEITKKLLNYIAKKSPDSKTIVFSKRTEQSIVICGEDAVYNGKIPKKKADQNFIDFNSGKLKVLGVCDKVNRGSNIDGLDTAILETYFGSDTKATQRLGRLMRLKPDQVATVYILLPYYMRREKDKTYTLQETQQVKWARNMLRSTNVKSSEVWNYCAVKPKTND